MLSDSLGRGSLTCFPVIETLVSDVSSYITTNVVSITDGQLFLSLNLFLTGLRPAVDHGLSVSRIGSTAQWQGTCLVAGSLKLEIAQFAELQAFSLFSQGLGGKTLAQLASGAVMMVMIQQPTGAPLSLALQMFILHLHQYWQHSSNNDLPQLRSLKLCSGWSICLRLPLFAFFAVPTFLLGLAVLSL